MMKQSRKLTRYAAASFSYKLDKKGEDKVDLCILYKLIIGVS